MLRNPAAILILSCLLLAPAGFAQAQQGADDVDYLELAARLIGDGHYDRAEAALRNVDLEARGVDLARYHTLAGLVALRSERAREAIESLDLALTEYRRREQEETPAAAREATAERERAVQRVHLYLGQAHMRERNYRQAIASFDSAGETGAEIAMVHALRAQAHWELGEHEAAFAALDAGAARFGDDHRFLRRKVFYLIHLGFYQHAAELGRRYLEVAAPEPEDFLAIGSALRRSGQHDAALTILERARLVHPGSRDIAIELAHAWLGLDRTGAAAEVLADAAAYDPALLQEAAELLRRAGRHYRALLLNGAIADQPRKYRQRLGILVAMEQWDQAAAMGDALRRNRLLDSDDIRYAYAYVLFRTGDYESAGRMLDGISAAAEFRQAAELRKVMDQCRDARWQCM